MFHLSGSGLPVQVGPVPWDAPHDAGQCESGVEAEIPWQSRWPSCALALQLVAVVAPCLEAIKPAAVHVSVVMRRFDVAVDSVVQWICSARGWLSMLDVLASATGALLVLSYIVTGLSVHRVMLMDAFIVTMGLSLVIQHGSDHGAPVGLNDVLAGANETGVRVGGVTPVTANEGYLCPDAPLEPDTLVSVADKFLLVEMAEAGTVVCCGARGAVAAMCCGAIGAVATIYCGAIGAVAATYCGASGTVAAI